LALAPLHVAAESVQAFSGNVVSSFSGVVISTIAVSSSGHL